MYHRPGCGSQNMTSPQVRPVESGRDVVKIVAGRWDKDGLWAGQRPGRFKTILFPMGRSQKIIHSLSSLELHAKITQIETCKKYININKNAISNKPNVHLWVIGSFLFSFYFLVWAVKRIALVICYWL